MKTLQQLKQYLENNGFCMNQISIGRNFCGEGIVLEQQNGNYCFLFSERGHKQLIASFDTEEKLVEYALVQLKKSGRLWLHLVAQTESKAKIEQAEQELKRQKIAFERNDIPAGVFAKTKYRIFVYGTPESLPDGFCERYCKQQ